MPGRRALAQPAQLDSYVLHRYDWSESSLILDVFTRERGRLAVIAKGAKRPTSQLRSVLMPFQCVQLTLARQAVDEQGEIHVLRHAEWLGGGPVMPAASLFQGFYLNELLMKLLARNDAHAALFDAYAATLPALAHGDEALAQAGLRAFELRLLSETGVLPDLSVTTVGHQALQPGQAYLLRPEVGLVPATEAGAPGLLSGELRALQAALEGPSARALQIACAACLPALRPMLRHWLHYHLGTTTLRTRDVMQSLQRLMDPATRRPAESPRPRPRPSP
ncbi:MAG: DNA repair protein RecO [Rubrivivax sp.]|nr:DNA repair protein RecO [Rubrivivax sp.]